MIGCSVEGCDHPIENHDLKLCSTHNRERRKKKKGQPVRSRIKRVSSSMMKKIRVYVQLKRIWIVDKDCEVCGGHATEVHHAKGRLGALLLAVEWWLPVCRFCHKRIEENPEWAYDQGYSFSRLGNG